MEKKVVKMEEEDSVLYKIDNLKFDELKSQMETEWEGHKAHQSTTTERGIEVRTILMMLDWIEDNSK
jgi:spore coat protein CotH